MRSEEELNPGPLDLLGYACFLLEVEGGMKVKENL